MLAGDVRQRAAWLSAVTAALPGPVWGSCMSRYPTELIVSMMATTPNISMNAGWWCHADLGLSAPTTSVMVIRRWSSSRRSATGRKATSWRS